MCILREKQISDKGVGNKEVEWDKKPTLLCFYLCIFPTGSVLIIFNSSYCFKCRLVIQCFPFRMLILVANRQINSRNAKFNEYFGAVKSAGNHFPIRHAGERSSCFKNAAVVVATKWHDASVRSDDVVRSAAVNDNRGVDVLQKCWVDMARSEAADFFDRKGDFKYSLEAEE
jgi:hypothetical protein